MEMRITDYIWPAIFVLGIGGVCGCMHGTEDAKSASAQDSSALSKKGEQVIKGIEIIAQDSFDRALEQDQQAILITSEEPFRAQAKVPALWIDEQIVKPDEAYYRKPNELVFVVSSEELPAQGRIYFGYATGAADTKNRIDTSHVYDRSENTVQRRE